MSTEQPKYSRAEISDESKRKKAAEEIKTASKWVDKKKTPEGKKELSQTWVQKANLTPAQKETLCDELLVKDIDSEDPKELERRVIALQKHLGFPEKDCDGILWWKTLEKVDQMVEDQHKLEDEDSGEKNEDNGYGLDRVAHEEQRKKEKAEKPVQLKKQLAAWQTEGLEDINGSILQVEDGENGEKLLRWTGENSDKYYDIDSWTYETKDERTSRIAKVNSETQNQREQELAALKKNMNSGDRGVTENLVYWEDQLSVQIGENGDKYLQRDSDGKILNFETGEYESMEDRTTRLAKSKDATTEEYKAKMREISEEMRSNPDVYSGTETEKSTYTFNGEELSLEWEAPNQYITRTVNGKEQMWESESESWEDIKDINEEESALAETESGIKKVKSVIEKWYSQDFQGLQKALTELGITSATISGKKLQTITLWDMLSTVTSTGKVGKEWAEMLLNHFLWVHIRNGVIEAGKQIWDSMGTEVLNTAQDDINKQREISQKFSTIIQKWGDATLGDIFDAWLTHLDGTARLATAPVRYATAPIRWFMKRVSSWFSGK